MKSLNVINEKNAMLPSVAFGAIKDAALGKRYKMNVIIASAQRMEELNTIYRGKEKPTDILSFPITDDEGEIYICLSEARKEAKKFGRSFENFLSFLFIHGCVHLKGMDHSATMEREEEKLRQKFGI